jgi:hypothetical protein
MAAARAEAKHGAKWIGAPSVPTWRRVLILTEEELELTWALISWTLRIGSWERVREESEDVAACIIGILEVRP